LGTSFVLVQLAQVVLVILYEKVEYDTFSFYFSKVELMRWWTSAVHPVMSSVQEFLPIGYSRLQMLFAGGSDFARNQLNFLVVLGVGLYLARYMRAHFFAFAFLALANATLFMQYTGYKTDAPLAALSLLLIHVVSQPYFRLQITVITGLCLVLLSIKWSGGIILAVAGLLYIPTLWRIARERTPVTADFLFAGGATVLLFNALDLSTYIDAFQKTGSFTPTQSFGVAPLSFGWKNLLVGLPQYLSVCVVETFEPLWRRLRDIQQLGPFLEAVTFGAKDYVILSSGEMRQSLTAFDALAFFASAFTLVARRDDAFVRNCAIASLVFTAVVLMAYPYQPFWNNRYFLPAQLLGYVPLAWLTMEWCGRRFAGTSVVLIATGHLIISAYYIVRDHERNLVTINDISVITTKQIAAGDLPAPVWFPPIYRQTLTERVFHGWLGFKVVYDSMHKTMTAADPLQIVTDSRASNADYSYPFLRERQVANTTLIDVARTSLSLDKPFVICFSASACRLVAQSSGYAKIADQGPTIALWQKLQ